MATDQTLLEVAGLHAYYGKSHILQGVELRVARREIVGLLGRNGVGRSTLLKAIMGEVAPRGSIRFQGRQLAGQEPFTIARLGLGYVPETRDIFPTLTVRQNLLLGMKSGRQPGRWPLAELLERFPNLAQRLDVPGGALSGGEQQLLSVCRTLLGDPDLLLIDEPTEGLAPGLVSQMAALLREIAARDVAILLVEQKLHLVLNLARRLYVMGRGRLVWEGTPDELGQAHAVRAEWLEV